MKKYIDKKNRIIQRIRREVFSRFYKDVGGQEDCIFIAGSGRSGTTWIADTVAQIFDFRLVFEPFWHLHIERNGVPDFYHHRYISSCTDEFNLEISKVLDCKFKNYNANMNFKYGPFHGRVIKDICANLYIDKLREARPDMPIIFVIRSPYDVIESRFTKSRWERPWGAHANIFNNQPGLVSQVGMSLIPGDEFEDHVISYCFENILPLKSALSAESPFLLVKYEAFKESPLAHVDAIIKYSGFEGKSKSRVYQDKYLMTSDESEKVLRNKNIVVTSNLSNKEINSINSILDRFGMWELFDNLGLGYERRN
jgi:hypothetical protein